MSTMSYSKDTPANVEREIEKTADLLRRMAAELGRTPTTNEYKAVRAANRCATFYYFTANGVQWDSIVERAGLTPRSSGQTAGKRTTHTEAAAQREIADAYTERREHDSRRKEWPLRAIYTRTEVIDYPLTDGSGVYRVTSTYASLR